MKKILITILTLIPAVSSPQTSWTAQRCMRYAVEHNHDVRRTALTLDNCQAAKIGAVGKFLPIVDAGVGVQYNFGRAIDPETNGYTDVSTFYNGYSVSASLPVFDGFSRLHALRAARASVLMGQNALRVQQNQTALATLQAYADVLYYEGIVRMACERQQETDLLWRQTQVMVEVGRKSQADLAQMEAQQAEAAYELTRQQNLLASALLELKKQMAYPLEDSLKCNQWDNIPHPKAYAQGTDISLHPASLQAFYRMQASKAEWCQARASLFPTLSLSAGLSTTFYKTLHSPNTTSFSEQFRNNMGEYVAATVSIPLFNRLQTITGIRRAKNNYRMAQEDYAQQQMELRKLSMEAEQDMHAYQRQVVQMEHKVEADSLAYQLTRRQYEEGLSTAIDLHTTSVQLLQSRAILLQCQLMAMVKEQLVRYYQGEQIWTE